MVVGLVEMDDGEERARRNALRGETVRLYA